MKTNRNGVDVQRNQAVNFSQVPYLGLAQNEATMISVVMITMPMANAENRITITSACLWMLSKALTGNRSHRTLKEIGCRRLICSTSSGRGS